MKIKLSRILAILVIMQFIYTVGLTKNWWISPLGFPLTHEDLILTLNLMTWFIVSTIENCNKRTMK